MTSRKRDYHLMTMFRKRDYHMIITFLKRDYHPGSGGSLTIIIMTVIHFRCSNSAPTPKKNINTETEDAELSLKASAILLSDTDNLFLRYLVSIDGLRDEPAQGSYEYQDKSGKLNNLEFNKRPSISISSTIASGEYLNHGYRLVLRTELTSFDQATATFSIVGDYEFCRPRTDSDKPGRLPIVWEAKQEFPAKTVVLNWGETKSISFDISQAVRFDPFRDSVGDEITVTINNPEWSSMPWERASPRD